MPQDPNTAATVITAAILILAVVGLVFLSATLVSRLFALACS